MYDLGQIFIVVNTQIWKNKQPIWSHWLELTSFMAAEEGIELWVPLAE